MRNEVFNVLICNGTEKLLKNFFKQHIIQKNTRYYWDFNKSIPSEKKTNIHYGEQKVWVNYLIWELSNI